jgi:hypothetical protein
MVLKDRCRFSSQERACFLEYGLLIGEANEAQLFLGTRLKNTKQTGGSERANFECSLLVTSLVYGLGDRCTRPSHESIRVIPAAGHDIQRTAIRAELVGWCSTMLRMRSFGPIPTHPTVGCTFVVSVTIQLAISLHPTLPGSRIGILPFVGIRRHESSA